MLNIVTWLWRQPGGRTAYTAEHVNIWAAMVTRHLTLPHRLACVADTPAGIRADVAIITPPRDFEHVELPTWSGGLPRCLRRLALFRPDAADIFGERFVSMDMDCVVAGSLDPVFDRPEDFVMYRGTNGSRPYNGSMLMMTAGARPQVFRDFTPDLAVRAGYQFIGSDQAWISYCLGWREATWGPEHGVGWWQSQRNLPGISLMFFPGHPKPWNLIGQSGWIDEHYRGAGNGRCLILGHGPSVWDDAAKVSGPFGAIIGSPEAAEHVDVDMIVNNDRDALVTATALGFDEIVFCGRSAA